MSTTAHWPVPTTPVQPRALHPDVPQTPVQPRALKDDITKTPVQPVMVNTPLTQNPVQPHATNMPLTQTPVQPRQMPVATSTPLNGIASTNNEGTDDVVNDLGMGTSDSEGTEDIDGLGRTNGVGLPRFDKSWRLLSQAETDRLQRDFQCIKTLQNSTGHDIGDGARTIVFRCNSLYFMKLLYGQIPNGNFRYSAYYVQDHPGPLVKPSTQQQAYMRLHGVPTMNTSCAHWPSLAGVPRGVGQAAIPNPQNRAEINAANDLLAYLATSGCSKQSLPVVIAFQNAYNASGLPGRLTVDGQYGPNTQRALQNTLDEAQNDAGAGPSEGAPANCFPEYGQEPSIPQLDRPVAPTPSPAPPSTTTTTTTVTGDAAKKKSSAGVIIVGATAAAVAGGLGYMYYRKRRSRR